MIGTTEGCNGGREREIKEGEREEAEKNIKQDKYRKAIL